MTYEKIAFQGGRIRRIAKNKRRSKVKGISSHRREMWALARDYVKSEMGKPS